MLSPNNREFRSVSKLQVPNLLRSLASRVITCDEARLTYTDQRKRAFLIGLLRPASFILERCGGVVIETSFKDYYVMSTLSINFC